MKRLPRLSKSGVLTPPQWDQVARAIEANFRELTIQPGIGYTVRNSNGGCSLLIDSQSTEQAARLPWDISGAGSVTIWPGSIQGLMPSNMFEEFSVTPNAINYVIASVTCDGVSVTGIELSVETTAPDGQTPAENGYPSDFGIILGVIKDGASYNVWKRSFGLQPVIALGGSGSFKGIWKVG